MTQQSNEIEVTINRLGAWHLRGTGVLYLRCKALERGGWRQIARAHISLRISQLYSIFVRINANINHSINYFGEAYQY